MEATSTIEILHDIAANGGSFYVADGDKHVAEMSYIRHDDKLVTIDHTAVDNRFHGQGVGRRLLDAAVAWARETDNRFIVTCSYARSQFEKDVTIRDVLAQD